MDLFFYSLYDAVVALEKPLNVQMMLINTSSPAQLQVNPHSSPSAVLPVLSAE